MLDGGGGGDQVVNLTNATVDNQTLTMPATGGSFAPTCTLPQATISLIKNPGTDNTAIDETLAAQSKDTGNVYRQVDCKYISRSGGATRQMRVAGIDGTKGGWVVIVLEDGEVAADLLLRPIETRFEELSDAAVLAIDVPIGFGPRAADAAARKYLVGAASTVFKTPTRETLEVPFEQGLGVSAQAHALGNRIIHVTRLAARHLVLRLRSASHIGLDQRPSAAAIPKAGESRPRGLEIVSRLPPTLL